MTLSFTDSSCTRSSGAIVFCLTGPECLVSHSALVRSIIPVVMAVTERWPSKGNTRKSKSAR